MPNKTKLTITSIPKGRGHKGSKPPWKRRPLVPIETKIELNPLSSEPTTTTAIEIEVPISLSKTILSPSLTATIPVAVLTYSMPGSFPTTSASFPIMPPTVPVCHPKAPCSSQFPFLSIPFIHPQTALSSSYGLDPTDRGTNPLRHHRQYHCLQWLQ